MAFIEDNDGVLWDEGSFFLPQPTIQNIVVRHKDEMRNLLGSFLKEEWAKCLTFSFIGKFLKVHHVS